MRAYSPGGTFNAFASVPTLRPPPDVHRLLCGLPGYLNLFAPRTFAPQRQYMARYLPSPSVFFQISTDFTPTPGIPISPPVLKSDSFQRMTGLSPEFLHQTCLTACVPFTPNNSEQRSQLTCYRGCWHVISRCLFMTYSHHQAFLSPGLFLSHKRILQSSDLHHPRGVAPSEFPPLRNILSCCLP